MGAGSRLAIDCPGPGPPAAADLIAEKNHGPRIPCGAAIALGKKIAGGAALPKGAMPCLGLLTVEEFLEPLRDLQVSEIVTLSGSLRPLRS